MGTTIETVATETSTIIGDFSPLTFMLIFLIGIFIVLVATSVKIIPQSEEWTLERFGRFTRILRPGIHIVTPFVERIGGKMSLRERVLDVAPQDVISKDNAMVKVDGVIFYRVFDSKKACYQVGQLRFAIAQLVMTNIRALMGKMQLDEMLSNRGGLNGKLLEIVDKATDPWGIQVTRVEIKDIRPPKDLQNAMSRQMKAERERRAIMLEAEGQREAAIKQAEGEKESAIRVAEGQQQAVVLTAQALRQKAFLEAEALERTGEAKAKALATVAKALSSGTGKAANYFLSEQYIKSLGDLASSNSSKTVFMPFEASKLLSSVGSLGALAKDLLGDSKK